MILLHHTQTKGCFCSIQNIERNHNTIFSNYSKLKMKWVSNKNIDLFFDQPRPESTRDLSETFLAPRRPIFVFVLDRSVCFRVSINWVLVLTPQADGVISRILRWEAVTNKVLWTNNSWKYIHTQRSKHRKYWILQHLLHSKLDGEKEKWNEFFFSILRIFST